MNDTLTVESVPKSWTGVPQSSVAPPAQTSDRAGIGSWATVTDEATAPHPAGRRHTPITTAAADKAAVARSTARLTYSAGWSSKKAITFDAAI